MHLVMGNIPENTFCLKYSGMRHHAFQLLGHTLQRGLSLRHPSVERRDIEAILRVPVEDVLSLLLNLIHTDKHAINLGVDSLELILVGLELGVVPGQVGAMRPG